MSETSFFRFKSRDMSQFEKMKKQHEERRAEQRRRSAAGEDFIAESRAGAIGRLVDQLIDNNPAYRRIPKVNSLNPNTSKHQERWKREDELAAQGVDYILESRKGPIGRLVKRLPEDFPLRDKIIAESERKQKLIRGSEDDDPSP